MSRCPRCNGCISMYDREDCQHCAYPKSDKRTPGQIDIDDAETEEFYNINEENI